MVPAVPPPVLLHILAGLVLSAVAEYRGQAAEAGTVREVKMCKRGGAAHLQPAIPDQ